MIVKKVLALLGIITLFSLSVQIDKVSAIDGVYKKIPGQKFTFDGKKVEVIEFLSFYCGHCYQFESAIPIIKGNFPKKINWKTVPVHWGQGSPKPGEAYLLAKEVGKGEQMKREIFKAIFVENRDIGREEVLEEIASRIGLGFDFSIKLRDGVKHDEIIKGIEMMRGYGIHETPTMVIAGNLKSSPGDLLGNMDAYKVNAIAIIKSILGE